VTLFLPQGIVGLIRKFVRPAPSPESISVDAPVVLAAVDTAPLEDAELEKAVATR
jgi:hypothetical protein